MKILTDKQYYNDLEHKPHIQKLCKNLANTPTYKHPHITITKYFVAEYIFKARFQLDPYRAFSQVTGEDIKTIEKKLISNPPRSKNKNTQHKLTTTYKQKHTNYKQKHTTNQNSNRKITKKQARKEVQQLKKHLLHLYEIATAELELLLHQTIIKNPRSSKAAEILFNLRYRNKEPNTTIKNKNLIQNRTKQNTTDNNNNNGKDINLTINANTNQSQNTKQQQNENKSKTFPRKPLLVVGE
jgi:hypothetical protein